MNTENLETCTSSSERVPFYQGFAYTCTGALQYTCINTCTNSWHSCYRANKYHKCTNIPIILFFFVLRCIYANSNVVWQSSVRHCCVGNPAYMFCVNTVVVNTVWLTWVHMKAWPYTIHRIPYACLQQPLLCVWDIVDTCAVCVGNHLHQQARRQGGWGVQKHSLELVHELHFLV